MSAIQRTIYKPHLKKGVPIPRSHPLPSPSRRVSIPTQPTKNRVEKRETFKKNPSWLSSLIKEEKVDSCLVLGSSSRTGPGRENKPPIRSPPPLIKEENVSRDELLGWNQARGLVLAAPPLIKEENVSRDELRIKLEDWSWPREQAADQEPSRGLVWPEKVEQAADQEPSRDGPEKVVEQVIDQGSLSYLIKLMDWSLPLGQAVDQGSLSSLLKDESVSRDKLLCVEQIKLVYS